MSTEVIALGALCDLVLPEERSPRSNADVSFSIQEFAILSDGRRIIVRGGLGYNVAGRHLKTNPWRVMTRERVEHDVRNAVLPDDDDSPDAHPYEYLSRVLLHRGIETSADHLRTLPYTVEFSERLKRRFEEARSSEPHL